MLYLYLTIPILSPGFVHIFKGLKTVIPAHNRGADASEGRLSMSIVIKESSLENTWNFMSKFIVRVYQA